ncbi:hypothetical protein BRPE64_ACDS00660 [Caballeronia insecticola]|uniref:Uncharacterized protein n=1 Tax=Caballeronia insecticola TaxID=758793 RepID=R4WLX0_9BURK|nr:hypothetical protein BRPE64_ACDS00660 [Caballeronia insecticola]
MYVRQCNILCRQMRNVFAQSPGFDAHRQTSASFSRRWREIFSIRRRYT